MEPLCLGDSHIIITEDFFARRVKKICNNDRKSINNTLDVGICFILKRCLLN